MKNKNVRKINIILAVVMLFAASFSYPLTSFSKTQEELQAELAEVEKQIAEQEKQLAGIQGEKQTVQNKLNELKLSQNNLKLQIKSTNLKINQLDQQIDQTKDTIEGTIQRLEAIKPQIADLVREMHDKEKQSFVMMFFSQDSLSSALDEIGQMEKISRDLTDLSNEMRELKSNLEGQQVVLEDQQEDAKNLLNIQALQESEFKVKVQEQDYVLSMTKAQEAEYQKILNQTKARASEIRARLYDLAGGGDRDVTFGEAVEIAKYASELTGVRPALLLAVLTQESNLGKNVGTCNRAGDPPSKGYREIMHPTRDIPKYLAVVQELGLDPETTPLSCPMRDSRGRRVGWGGAMGPAQFIPSTWVGYKDRVTALTGKAANPWDIKDAFLAAALLLKANGATAEGETGEWKAAMRYFSGSTNTRFRFYGDNVLALARRYQAELDALGGGGQ